MGPLLCTACLAETINQAIHIPREMGLEFTSVWLGASPLVPGQPLQSLSKPMQIQLDRKRRTNCHTSNTAEELLKRQVFQHPSWAATLPLAFAQFSTSFAMLSLELQKCTLNPVCTFCYITTAHSNDSCNVFWTSWTQNIPYRISSFSCPSPSCLFTKNFHFLSDTNTSSGDLLTVVLQFLSTHTWIIAPQGT